MTREVDPRDVLTGGRRRRAQYAREFIVLIAIGALIVWGLLAIAPGGPVH
jgi:hypothetical protein